MTDLKKQEKEQNFLPLGYTLPDKARQFMKFREGDNNIRVLSQPLLGWVIFSEENKPIRKKFSDGNFTHTELEEFNAKKNKQGDFESARHFWILLVWEVDDDAPRILEITQVKVLKFLNTLIQSPKWGDLRQYEITINRTGTTKENTEYAVMPSPKEAFTPTIKKFLKEAKEDQLVDLEAIWKGNYPFENYLY
jgi:hypothetical protein